MVEFSLANFKVIIEKARDRRRATVAAVEARDVDQLAPIAKLCREGLSQAEIANRIGTAQSTVSKRIMKIKTKYPWMLEGEEGNNSDIPEYSINSENIPEYSDNSNYSDNIPKTQYIF